VGTTTISLPDEQIARLRILAIASGRSLDAVLREAVDTYLAGRADTPTTRATPPANDIPDDEWQARFGTVIERIRRAGPTDLTPAEIEREITLAREEARHRLSD
jgi:plasmid stability protein